MTCIRSSYRQCYERRSWRYSSALGARYLLGSCIFCIYTNGVCAGCQYDLGEDFPIKAYHAAMKIDLHCHSTASDGSLTPRELIQRAHNLHVNILALTDHDTLAGIEPALHALGEIKGGTPLRLVNGIEIS